MGGKQNAGGDGTQEEILRKLEDNTSQRQIDIGGGVMVNVGQEDYGETLFCLWWIIQCGSSGNV